MRGGLIVSQLITVSFSGQDDVLSLVRLRYGRCWIVGVGCEVLGIYICVSLSELH